MKSGALITARFALEQNRDLWVASAGIKSSKENSYTLFDKRGTTKLAEDGAGIVKSASDILEAWNIETAGNEALEASNSSFVSSLAGSIGIKI
jgi:predicted Rossmann fold nucleotide-binding protein DprA/Smf involved in DNA uptake